MGAPGFDDAPMVLPELGSPKPVQFAYPYYENAQFFERQLNLWESYPDELRQWISILVADDGSPDHPAVDVIRARPAPLRIKLRLFRIEVDVRWNWLAARNLMLHHAAEGWCVMTDMDHMIPAHVADRLVHCNHDPGVIYRFSREEHTGERIHPHPNSMLMTRAMFWRAGGYDEALSGHYGTDGDWRRRCADTASVRTLPDALRRYEHIGDSSTKHYKRKQPQDAGKKAIIRARGIGWRPRVLSFPAHEEQL